MPDESHPATRQRTPGSNASDPSADRMAAYPDAGELGSPQTAHDVVGQELEPTPSGPEPAGMDAELLQIGGSGDRLGGTHATDKPGQPGMPGDDQPIEDSRARADEGADSSTVDRLDR
jgi:hypothetical protein